MEHTIPFWEELQGNAFPALQMVQYDGWSLRFGGNFTYRVNCADPIYPSALPPREKVEYIEQRYRESGLNACIFKLHEGMGSRAAVYDALLDERGYATERRGNLFVCPLEGFVNPSPMRVLLNERMEDGWLTEFLNMNGTKDPRQREAAFVMLKNIHYPILAASIEHEGKTVACGLGVCERGCVGLYDIFVDPAARRHHLGQALCAAIMARGREMGCDTAYLQVLSDNAAARALYKGLGYTSGYEYWFRILRFQGASK